MIQFNNVGKTWDDGSCALKSISLSVPKGQFCVVLGPSGAGKSTLLRTINGLCIPSIGHIMIDGDTLSQKNQQRLRQRVAMVHQHFNLSLRLSVSANVLTGVLAQTSLWRSLLGWFSPSHRQKACLLLEKVGLKPRHLQRRASELSGGQQQRVGIARAFMSDPEIVLADEPVASLDPKISRDILQLIKDTASERNTTVLCSLHQIDLAREFADRLIGMRDGVIVFDGTPAEFTDEMLQKLYAGAHWDDEATSNNQNDLEESTRNNITHLAQQVAA
ncbi:MAG: phosphonate ABC transporter ATP-binding protein [Undibacterium sp.]|nr:phosphonate ABC transporter ATP-binding protein [Undibacterium sp.]